MTKKKHLGTVGDWSQQPPGDDERPEPLHPAMRMILQAAKCMCSPMHHDGLTRKALYFQTLYRNANSFKAEAAFMRAVQDGINFGKWG